MSDYQMEVISLPDNGQLESEAPEKDFLQNIKPLALPQWFAPKKLIVTGHANKRFRDRIYPGITFEEAQVIIAHSIAECWCKKGLKFFKSFVTDTAWLVRVHSDDYQLDFIIVMDYNDTNNNGMLDDGDLPVVITVLHPALPQDEVLISTIRRLNLRIQELNGNQHKYNAMVELRHAKEIASLKDKMAEKLALENKKAREYWKDQFTGTPHTVKQPTGTPVAATTIPKGFVNQQVLNEKTAQYEVLKAKYEALNQKLNNLSNGVEHVFSYEILRKTRASIRQLKRLHAILSECRTNWGLHNNLDIPQDMHPKRLLAMKNFDIKYGINARERIRTASVEEVSE